MTENTAIDCFDFLKTAIFPFFFPCFRYKSLFLQNKGFYNDEVFHHTLHIPLHGFICQAQVSSQGSHPSFCSHHST